MRAKARQNIHMKACESARERTRGSPGGTHKYASVTCPRGMSTWHSSSDHVDAYVARPSQNHIAADMILGGRTFVEIEVEKACTRLLRLLLLLLFIRVRVIIHVGL